MMRKILSAAALFLALPLGAQQPAAEKPVAVVNGQTITARQLDQLYGRLGAQMREQYEKAGGKSAFLENYLRKRLVIQEALKAGFDKRPDVRADMEASKEATLFDRYVRDVVSAGIVTDSSIRDYYNQHLKNFATPERIHVRHIVIGISNTGPQARTAEQALEIIKKIDTELHGFIASVRGANQTATTQLIRNDFAQLARRYSEDASAESGGDLGWVTRGQLDPQFEAAAFELPVGLPSGIVRSKFGYHLILVDGKEPPGTEPFDSVKPTIREFLMNEHAAEVMQTLTKLTNELRANSKVAIYPENIK